MREGAGKASCVPVARRGKERWTMTKAVDASKILDEIWRVRDDPLGFVHFAFPWGEENGPLANHPGPDDWQTDVLRELGRGARHPNKPCRVAIASGHGIGKGALTAWTILWFMSTRENPQIVVTANTSTQLSTKTWRELAKWHKMALNESWFVHTATRFYHKERPDLWYAAAIPWSDEHSEAFAGTHEQDVLMIFDEACHDDQTDVLTSEGWKRFANLTGKEKLLTMDPETGIAEYLAPVRLHRNHFEGELFTYDRRGGSFSVTPNHRMFHRVQRNQGRKCHYSPWKFAEIKNINRDNFQIPRKIDIQHPPQAFFTIPAFSSPRKSWEAQKVPMDAWLELCGWYFSEGCIMRDGKKRPVGISITQKDPAVLEEIQGILKRLGISGRVCFSPSSPQVKIGDTRLGNYFAQFGGNCLDKRLPGFLRTLSKSQIRLFLDTFLRGDGYHHGTRDIFYTSSVQIADGLQELILLGGDASTVTVRKLAGKRTWIKNHWAISSKDGYVVTRTPTMDVNLYVRTKHIRKTPYSGMVYCAELPRHHLLFTRRNGKVMWSGNSAISDKIWEVASGAMTTPGAFWLVMGNPTRNTGMFRECFREFSHRWKTFQIDSRTCRMTNKAVLQEWVDDWGLDSDFVKVRVRGVFPAQSVAQLISEDAVQKAMRRSPHPSVFRDSPILLGVDCAWFGDDQSVICIRQGCKIHELKRYSGFDTQQLALEVTRVWDEWNADVAFVDATGIGAGVYDRLRELGREAIAVMAAERRGIAPQFYNLRAQMWWKMREWILLSGALPLDRDLAKELTATEYFYANSGAIQLEKKTDLKARINHSPDSADSLALTFAYPVTLRHVPDAFLYPSRLRRNTANPITGY
jgi:hypothetical protein